MEQIFMWNPDIIITDEEMPLYEEIKEDEVWGELNAIKNNNVIGIPHRPYFWIDRPASANQILGVKWLGKELYPELYDYDIASEVVIFFKTFFYYDLTEDELEEIIY